MAVHAPRLGASSTGQQRSLSQNVLPPPVGGIDARRALGSNDPNTCLYAFNIAPAALGMEVRAGWREWVANLETGPGLGLGVRTLVPYQDPLGSSLLFAATNEGLWNVSSSTDSPTRDFAFSTTTGDAGWGHYVNFTTDAGETRLFYADEANGLHRFDGVSWEVPTDITGVPMGDIVFVMLHKQRIWFVERNSTDAWYLDIGAIAGALTKFSFGSKFKHGGDLVGVYNWTLDSGAGVDDVLVAVSRTGDVLPYEGEDPSLASSWRNIGTFYVGSVPAGRRIADEVGGDMHLLSVSGLTSMTDLLRGLAGGASQRELTSKISPYMREQVSRYQADRGWQISFYPNEGVVLINTPSQPNIGPLQWRLELAVPGWSQWRDVPALTLESWNSRVMFGTADGRVMRMDEKNDGGTIANPGSGRPIDFSLMHRYFDLGAPGLFKTVELIRPNLLIDQLRPGVTTKALYDYDIREVTSSGAAPAGGGTEAVWDTAKWDEAVWGSSQRAPETVLRGAWGYGRTVGIAVRGSGCARTLLASTDVLWRVATTGL